MWAKVVDGKVEQVILNPVPIKAGGVLHPAQILSAWSSKELLDIGIYPLEKKPFNSKFFTNKSTKFVVGKTKVTEEPVLEDKDIDELKAMLCKEANVRAYLILADTDWLVQRAWEQPDARPISKTLIDYREQVRIASDTKVSAIKALDTVKKLSEYDMNAGWPASPSSDHYTREEIAKAEHVRINKLKALLE